jgi:agmatine deiminase
MRNYFLYALLVLLGSCGEKKTPVFTMLPEWDSQKAVWLGWEKYEPYYKPTADLIKVLLPHVKVRIVVPHDSLIPGLKKYLASQQIVPDSIVILTMKDNAFWMRDHGATYLSDGLHNFKVADFNWNVYGIEEWYRNCFDNNTDSVKKYMNVSLTDIGKVDSIMASSENIPIVKTSVVMEGGSLEVNGKGTLILCEEVTMQRNPSSNKKELENEFKRVLGVKNIIWLKKGLADDSHIMNRITGKYIGFGTGGHTDEFVRFADEHTILLAWVDESEKSKHPIYEMNYQRMKENLKILENSTDQDGQPFNIIKVPLPDLIFKKVVIKNALNGDWDDGLLPRYFNKREGFSVGDTLFRVAACSYLNFLISNGCVILPNFQMHGSSVEKEGKVKDIMKKCFPGREIVFINTLSVNYEGGGIHCITKQEPSL